MLFKLSIEVNKYSAIPLYKLWYHSDWHVQAIAQDEQRLFSPVCGS